MRFPLLNLPVTYHVGTMVPAGKSAQSYEGHCLSVSLCPSAWGEIARIGGNTHRLCNPEALFLDALALDEEAKAAIREWAAESGLVRSAKRWAAWSYDDEREEWTYMTCKTRAEALAEVEEALDDGADLETPEAEGGPPGGRLVSGLSVLTLTAAGRSRAKGYPADIDAWDMAVTLWAEDYLKVRIPTVAGVWWQENFNPEMLSAPRGALFPSSLASMTVSVTDGGIPGDDELLAEMPLPRLLSEGDASSGFAFVTDCVSSTAALITPMAESPAVREMTYGVFAAALGSGDAAAGEEILAEVFPQYARLDLSMEQDRHVRYHASSFDGMPCLFAVHSAVEYVFQRAGMTDSPAAIKEIPWAEEEPSLSP